jgi:hypothetical protein
MHGRGTLASGKQSAQPSRLNQRYLRGDMHRRPCVRDLSPAGSASVPLDLDVVFLSWSVFFLPWFRSFTYLYVDMMMISAALLLLFDAAMASLLFFV